MNLVACSEVAPLPVPMRSFSPSSAQIEQKSRFTPGIPVKVLLESGGEHEALLRWSE